ncbi:MAG TPA: SpaA isopeptide-forming pilin-related protein [Caldilineaceae bacterium]|nr:SpaA isopeptide-forming pilin-related protein [Caldilineaceae bacterium]
MSSRMSMEWHSTKARLGLALLLSVLMILPFASVYAAGSVQGSGVVPTGSDICVEGTVIDHEEKPLDDGRIVTASYNGVSIAAAVDEDGEFEFDSGLTPGRWNFTIDVVKEGEEWEPVTPASFDVQLEYGQDDCYQIRFKLRRLMTVVVIKIDEDHNRLADWRIRAEPASGNKFAISYEEETNGNGEAIFRLTEGKWIFSELPPEDDDDLQYENVIPQWGTQELNVEDPGPYTIRFKNRLNIDGCIRVLKQDVPPADSGDAPFPLQGWKIWLERADGTVYKSGYTGADGKIKFDNLPFGPYTVVEETRVGWTASTASSFDVTVSPDDGGCILVVFDNAQSEPEYCIEGYKVDANGGVGLPGWTITAEPLEKGDVEPDDVVTDGLGMYKFTFSGNDYRVPGSRYEICEDYEDVEGWVAKSPICYTVTLPSTPGSCVQVPDFVNAQVGHSGSYSYSSHERSGKHYEGSCSEIYKVKPGDSLYGIGNRYGVSGGAMLDANPWVRNNRNLAIYVGQEICIP